MVIFRTELEVGFFIKQKYSRQLALTTRGLDFENKFSFYINV